MTTFTVGRDSGGCCETGIGTGEASASTVLQSAQTEAGTGRASCLTTGTPAAGGTSTGTTREMLPNAGFRLLKVYKFFQKKDQNQTTF